jgi:hypothetical protein
MPDVEDSGVGGSHDFDMTFDVLPVQHDVFTSPTNDFLVKPAHPQEVRPGKKDRSYELL